MTRRIFVETAELARLGRGGATVTVVLDEGIGVPCSLP